MARPKTFKRKPEIYRTVARLFARKGYERTSIRDITSELGMSKSSLYYYFRSKEELLFNLLNDSMDDALEVIDNICESGMDPLGKIEGVSRFYASFFAGDRDRLTLLSTEVNSLDGQYRELLLKKERKYVNRLRGVLEELNGQGGLKEIDPTVAAFAFFGMVHWTYKWYDPRGRINPEELADKFLEIFTRGILEKRDHATQASGDKVARS